MVNRIPTFIELGLLNVTQKILHEPMCMRQKWVLQRHLMAFREQVHEETLNMDYCLRFAYTVSLIDLFFLAFSAAPAMFSPNTNDVITGAVRLLFVCSNQCPQPLRLDLSRLLSPTRQWKLETEWRIVGWQMTAHGAWSVQTPCNSLLAQLPVFIAKEKYKLSNINCMVFC